MQVPRFDISQHTLITALFKKEESLTKVVAAAHDGDVKVAGRSPFLALLPFLSRLVSGQPGVQHAQPWAERVHGGPVHEGPFCSLRLLWFPCNHEAVAPHAVHSQPLLGFVQHCEAHSLHQADIDVSSPADKHVRTTFSCCLKVPSVASKPCKSRQSLPCPSFVLCSALNIRCAENNTAHSDCTQ